MHKSNWTGRYPRTLEQAFGPHTSKQIHERYDPMPKADRIVLTVSLIVMLLVTVLIVTGVIQ